MRIPAIGAVILGVAIVVLGLQLNASGNDVVIGRGGARSTSLSMLAVIIGAILVILGISFFVVVQGALHRVKEFRSDDSITFVSRRTPQLVDLVAARGDEKVPTYVAVRIDRGGLTIRSGRTTDPILELAAQDIVALGTTSVLDEGPLPALLIEIRPIERINKLSLTVSRGGWEIFPIADWAKLAAFSTRIAKLLDKPAGLREGPESPRYPEQQRP